MKTELMKLVAKAKLSYANAKSRVEEKLKDDSGSTFVDTLIGILIVLVVGAIIIGALNIFFPTLMNQITTAITDFFTIWLNTTTP